MRLRPPFRILVTLDRQVRPVARPSQAGKGCQTPSPTEITVPQLARLVGTPDAPTLIDLRTDEDFAANPQLIPGAFLPRFAEVATLVPALRHRLAVAYCQKGRKISQGAAALLRTEGLVCGVLEGGQIAWRGAGGPMIAATALPAPDADAEGRSLWVTRHRPKIDRIACP